jgi:hypothetical protein
MGHKKKNTVDDRLPVPPKLESFLSARFPDAHRIDVEWVASMGTHQVHKCVKRFRVRVPDTVSVEVWTRKILVAAMEHAQGLSDPHDQSYRVRLVYCNGIRSRAPSTHHAFFPFLVVKKLAGPRTRYAEAQKLLIDSVTTLIHRALREHATLYRAAFPQATNIAVARASYLAVRSALAEMADAIEVLTGENPLPGQPAGSTMHGRPQP